MKRGDILATAIWLLQSSIAILLARRWSAEVPGLGDAYFNIPLTPIGESLRSIRTLGYPAFHRLMTELGWGLELYPVVQMGLLVCCTAIFALGLRLYGLTGLTAVAAASPLLWVVPVALVMPETPAKCFAIAATGFLLWAAGTRSRIAFAGLAITLFLAYQMRPAFLFLLVFLPMAWLFLYIRRWGFLDPRKCFRNAIYTAAACALPLLLFCLLRLAVVGHFGLVSFAGHNTIGITVEMLRPETVQRLPVSDQPLAMLMARARDGWPTDRFLTASHSDADWRANAIQYAANINRIGRATMAKFPPPGGAPDNVRQNETLSRMSRNTFLTHASHYVTWLKGATVESASLAVALVLGSHAGAAFGLPPSYAIPLAAGMIALVLLSWPLARLAFGEGSRPFSGHAVSVVALIAALFFLLKMLLVVLVEPPLPRYVQAALLFVPAAAAVLCWERLVVLAAALWNRPSWYGQCLVAYPPIPDAHRPIRWRAWFWRFRPGRRTTLALAATLVLAAGVYWWGTRDDRLFRALADNPDAVRETLLTSPRYHDWRGPENATVLHYAARQNDTELVDQLASDTELLNARTNDGASPLHWNTMAATGGDVTATLLEAGLSADAPGPLGLTPVHLASLFGNAPALQALLAHGGTPDQKSPGHVAPLHLARTPAVASVLVEHGADIDIRDGSQATPFMWAHNRELAAWFLAHGADINARENWRSFIRGCTPLHKAVYQDDVDQSRWLLDHGADPNAGDINGFTPLFYAIWRNNTHLAAMLLDAGADIHHAGRWLAFNREDPTHRYTDIFGKTIGRHPKRDTFAALVPDGATIHPLDWAAFRGNQEFLRFLANRGADLGRQNEVGMTPAHWAYLGWQGDAVKLLQSLAEEPAVVDSKKLPLERFWSDVQKGQRTTTPPAEASPPTDAAPAPSSPAPEPPDPESRRAVLDKAQQVVDEYNAGAPNILEGEDGFLFTRQACMYLLQEDFRYADPGVESSGPSPALASIVDIDRQLDARGIHLIVVPAPMAIEVHADAFHPSWDYTQPVFPARGYFIAALNGAGVDAIDLFPAFVEYRKANPAEPLYLKGDGHWNSAAIGIAAGVLAERFRDLDLDLGLDQTAYTLETIDHSVGLPYLAKRLPEERQASYDGAVWKVNRVLEADGKPYEASGDSPILVAGDSYTLIFKELGGQLSARLAADLGRPVDAYTGNAAGPIIPRVLARKGKEYIDRRKVIIWVFGSAYIRPAGKDQWGLLALP